MNTLKEVTEMLKNIDSKNYTPNDVRQLVFSLKGALIIPQLILNSNVILYRATIIEDLSELTNLKRLSYKPAFMNKSYARASTPYNTMFYAISANSNQEALMGALGEV